MVVLSWLVVGSVLHGLFCVLVGVVVRVCACRGRFIVWAFFVALNGAKYKKQGTKKEAIFSPLVLMV